MAKGFQKAGLPSGPPQAGSRCGWPRAAQPLLRRPAQAEAAAGPLGHGLRLGVIYPEELPMKIKRNQSRDPIFLGVPRSFRAGLKDSYHLARFQTPRIMAILQVYT